MSDPFDVSLRVRLAYEGGAAKTAVSDVEAIRAAAVKLGASSGTAALTADLEKAGRAADSLGDKLGAALKAQRAAGGFKNGAELEAFLKTFDAQVKTAQTGVGALAASANKLAASTGPVRLAEGLGGISPAAVEARRHIDDVGTAARSAQRDIERMGAASRGAGGGVGGRGVGGGHGAAGGGGLQGALIAGARPLRMERLVMSAMTPVGLAGLGAGLGLEKMVRGLAEAEGQAIALESAMVEVRRAIGDMPAAGVKGLENAILAVSRATGTANTELAGVAAAALRAGKPVEELPGFMERAAKTANVMGFSVAEAGDKLIGLSRAWKEDRAGVEDTTDAVALLAQRTGAKAGAVLDFVGANPDMRERHMSARQVAAFGAAFEVQGAGGAFRGLADKLAMPQKAGPEFEQRLFNLGIGPTQAREGMRNDPTRMMMQVLEKLKQLPDEHRANVLEQMFGPEGGRDIGRVVDHLDELKVALGLVENAAARNGALEKSFKLFDDTTRAKIDRASAAMGAFAAKMGQEFAPAVGKAAEATERLFNAMSAALDKGERLAKAAVILPKVVRGEALSPDEGKALDVDPALKADVERKAAVADEARERQRQSRLAGIRALQGHARKSGDASVGSALRDQTEIYRRDFPNAPDPLTPNPAAGGTARPSHDQRGSLVDLSMIHRAAYVEGEDGRASSGGSATDALRAVMAAATKEGVVAGLREVLDMRGGGAATGGIAELAGESGSTGGAYGAGGGTGARGNTPNMRYGRGGGDGSRYRSTPDGAPVHARGQLAANQQEAYKAFLEEGFNPTAARALVANDSGESLANPRNYHWDRHHMSGGIVQWDPERAAAIKTQFGDVPWNLSLRDQARAQAWEIRNNPRYAKTNRALQGTDGRAMIGALVENYEGPADVPGNIASRMGRYNGFHPDTGGPGPAPAATVGAHIADLKDNGLLTDEQCVTLAMASIGIKKGSGADGGNVHDWMKGAAAGSGRLIPGTPVATFLNRDGSPSDRYAGGGSGTPGAHLDHAGVFQSYMRDEAGKVVGMTIAEQYQGSRGVHMRDYRFGQGNGEDDASNYYAIRTKGGYLGGSANPMSGNIVSAAAMGTMDAGSAPGRAVDMANNMAGADEKMAASKLGHYMSHGEWCADFVNGVLEKAGIKGSGSAMSDSFRKWGQSVDRNAPKKGDVIVEYGKAIDGEKLGHAGLFNGQVQRDEKGRIVRYGMVSGNHDDQVIKDYWEDASRVTELRRATEAARGEHKPDASVGPRFSDPKTTRRHGSPADASMPGAGSQTQRVAAAPAPVQNFYGNHDPAQTARMAMLEQNREVRRTQARALHSVGRVA